MIRFIKCTRTNKITFYKNGNRVYPTSVKGNIAEFAPGEVILF